MASPVVVAQFSFSVLAATRDECVSKMDEVARSMFNEVGGEPWIMVDDDTVRQPSDNALRDDQGFRYIGTRTYIFKGPIVSDLSESLRDGFQLQRGVENG